MNAKNGIGRKEIDHEETTGNKHNSLFFHLLKPLRSFATRYR